MQTEAPALHCYLTSQCNVLWVKVAPIFLPGIWKSNKLMQCFCLPNPRQTILHSAAWVTSCRPPSSCSLVSLSNLNHLGQGAQTCHSTTWEMKAGTHESEASRDQITDTVSKNKQEQGTSRRGIYFVISKVSLWCNQHVHLYSRCWTGIGFSVLSSLLWCRVPVPSLIYIFRVFLKGVLKLHAAACTFWCTVLWVLTTIWSKTTSIKGGGALSPQKLVPWCHFTLLPYLYL